MKAKLTVRLISGREERFEIEVQTGTSAEFRLKEFSKDPTLLLQLGSELLLIPGHAIESLSLTAPATERELPPMTNVRKAKRLK